MRRSGLSQTSINIVGLQSLEQTCGIKVPQIPRLKSRAKFKSFPLFFLADSVCFYLTEFLFESDLNCREFWGEENEETVAL